MKGNYMSNRDNFTEKTVRLIAERVHYFCSNPNCRKQTSGPHTNPDKRINIGKAAHICAAAPGGPRYDPHMTPAKRKSSKNGIWLCSDCATLIDTDEVKFSKELLLAWKENAELRAERDLGKPSYQPKEQEGDEFITLEDHVRIAPIEFKIKKKTNLEPEKITFKLKITNCGNNSLRHLRIKYALTPYPDTEEIVGPFFENRQVTCHWECNSDDIDEDEDFTTLDPDCSENLILFHLYDVGEPTYIGKHTRLDIYIGGRQLEQYFSTHVPFFLEFSINNKKVITKKFALRDLFDAQFLFGGWEQEFVLNNLQCMANHLCGSWEDHNRTRGEKARTPKNIENVTRVIDKLWDFLIPPYWEKLNIELDRGRMDLIERYVKNRRLRDTPGNTGVTLVDIYDENVKMKQRNKN